MYVYSTSARNVRVHAALATRAYVQASVVLPLTCSVRGTREYSTRTHVDFASTRVSIKLLVICTVRTLPGKATSTYHTSSKIQPF